MASADRVRSVKEMPLLALLEEWKNDPSLTNRVLAQFFEAKTCHGPIQKDLTLGVALGDYEGICGFTKPDEQDAVFRLRLSSEGSRYGLVGLRLRIEGQPIDNRGYIGHGPTSALVDYNSGYKEDSMQVFIQVGIAVTYDDPRTAGLFLLLGELGKGHAAALAQKRSAENPRLASRISRTA